MFVRYLKSAHKHSLALALALSRSLSLSQVPEFQAFMNNHCGELVNICQKYLSNIVLRVKAAEDIDTDMVVSFAFELRVSQ